MNDHIPWMKNDALARQQMEIGWRWQRFVGAFFEALEFPVTLEVNSFRKSVAQIPEYSDSHDLVVAGERVEVKSRDLFFTSDPMSFPYETAFVDTVRKYNVHESQPIAYVFVSQKTGALVWTPGRDSSKWTKEGSPDHVRGIKDEFYLVSKNRLLPIDDLVRTLRLQG
jgi:hypothetical protein